MLEQICAYIHNYFYGETYEGEYTIENGALELPLLDGQYFRITGSRMNDGVYTYPADGLTDETFTGVIYEMRPPRRFLALVSEIEAWQDKYGAATASPYQSESFGGYSYSLKSGSSASGVTDSAAAGWQGVFRAYLNEWRKLA